MGIYPHRVLQLQLDLGTATRKNTSQRKLLLEERGFTFTPSQVKYPSVCVAETINVQLPFSFSVFGPFASMMSTAASTYRSQAAVWLLLCSLRNSMGLDGETCPDAQTWCRQISEDLMGNP